MLLPLILNGLCDRRRAEITVMQFTGHSLPVHHWSGTFTLSHIISKAHLRAFFRLLAIGMCHIRCLRNCRCDHHRAEITIMQFIGQSLPAHHFFYGTVRIFTLSHIVSQAVFYTFTLLTIYVWTWFSIKKKSECWYTIKPKQTNKQKNVILGKESIRINNIQWFPLNSSTLRIHSLFHPCVCTFIE